MHESSGGAVLWILLVVGVIFIGIPAATIWLAVHLRARRARAEFIGTTDATAANASAARTHARRVSWSGRAGLAVGVVAGLALLAINQAAFAALACGAGYLVGLLVGEYAAQPPSRGEQRAATLLARRPGDYAPRWAAACILAAEVLMLTAVIVYAVAPTIRYGSWHPYPAVRQFAFPGGTTAWPTLRATLTGIAFSAAVLLLGLAGLRRIASRPQLTDAGQQGIDDVLRRQAGRAITGAVLSLQLMLLAAFLLAGSAGLEVPAASISGAAYFGYQAMVLAGLACAAGCIVSWLVLSGRVRRRSKAGPSAGVTLRPEG